MVRIPIDMEADPIFQALNPEGKQFLRARTLPPPLNPYTEHFGISALVAFGEFQHIKVVPAFQMMFEDQRDGLYVNKHTIVVDSSGNTAYAVARLARAFGFRDVTVVMSADVPASKQDIFKALATVKIISVPKGESVAKAAMEEAQKPGHYHLNQYAHMGNMHAHEIYTGPEIVRELDGNISIIAIAIGSGGTAAGVARFLRKAYPRTQVLGVHPLLGQQVPGSRDQKKYEGVVPPEYRAEVDAVEYVSRKDAFVATRRLWSAVEPRPGPTSGLAYVGLMQYLKKIEPDSQLFKLLFQGKKVGFLCPDSADPYLTVINAELDTDQGLG